MNDLSTGWKLFRAMSIVQFILIALLLVKAIAMLFSSSAFWLNLCEITCFGSIFWLLFLGQSILNENYPDIPLSQHQKRKFNWLFILNVLAIVYLSARVISEWKQVSPISRKYNLSLTAYLLQDPMPVFYGIVFLFHLIFLAGMFRLRSSIHLHSVLRWQEQFAKNQD